MPFSVQKLLDRLPERPLRGAFLAGPLEIELYEEDPRELEPIISIEEDEDPSCAGGGLDSQLTLVWLRAQDGEPRRLLARSQGWSSPLLSADNAYQGGLLELQLFLRTIEFGQEEEVNYEDYTVDGMVFLQSRMGQRLRSDVAVLRLEPGGGGDLFVVRPPKAS